MNDTVLQAAYVLHYTDFRDTSFIVESFTLQHGRVSLVARGARSARSKTRALYQPFRPLLLSWAGRSELRTLTGIEDSGAAYQFDNKALACAYYVNELLLRLLGKDQAQPELFAHYVMALSALADESSVEKTLRTFELQLLEAIGILPDLSRCTAEGSAIDPQQQYRFHPANVVAVPLIEKANYGNLKPENTISVRDPSLHADGETVDAGIEISGQALLAMANLELSDPQVCEQAKPLMRQLLNIQLGGKPLKSRELFGALVKPGEPVSEA
ncbi:MAG: DNA repair protein RecO [Granulosicoccus sp.]